MTATARRLGRADAVAAADVLAAAFADDPVFAWLLPDPARRRGALRRYFALEARRVVLPHGRSVGAGGDRDLLGVALTLPPGRWRTPVWVQVVFAPRYVQVFRRRLLRAFAVLTVLERRHPREPHVYFPYIGVRPAEQGRGLGAAMLAAALADADRAGLPAYLEASNPDCARLYERLGFRTVETVTPVGSPPIRLMRRAPRTG